MAGKNPMTYNERLELWQKGICPYCGVSAAVVQTETHRKGLHFVCGACHAENHFSRRRTDGV